MFLRFVRSNCYHSVGSHGASHSHKRTSLSVIICLVDCHCLIDKMFDNIHKFYKLSCLNLHLVQGLLSVQAL
jgi:hypothetical protein